MWQLIYTSAPRGLASGQSGFCTVARSADLRDSVTHRLEQLSSYHYLELASGAKPGRNPTISAYRILDIRGAKYHALTRIRPCGLDFTARTNHLAQHLVFQADELPCLPSPAAIFRDWQGWLAEWQGDPRILPPAGLDIFSQIPPPSWPARAWQQLTGDAGRAAGLLEGECARGCYLLCPPGGEGNLLDLFCESLQLPNWTGNYPLRAWQYTFTTFLQGQDAPGDFHWRGCQENTPGCEHALRRSAALLRPQSIRVPANPLAKFAREGPKIAVASPSAASARAPLTLRREPPLPRRVAPIEASSRTSAARGSTSALNRGRKGSPDPQPSTLAWLNQPAAKGIVIALLLLLGLLAGRHYLASKNSGAATQSTSPEVARNPALDSRSVQGTPPNPALSTSPSLASPTPMPEAQAQAPLDPKLIQDLDGLHWQDAPIYLVIVPELSGQPLDVDWVMPLKPVLRQFDKLELLPSALEGTFNTDNWTFQYKNRLNFQSRGSRPECSLTGTGHLTDNTPIQVNFDFPRKPADSVTDPPVQIRVTCAKNLSSLWVLLSPANGLPGLFETFRLVVVNESHPPHAVELSKRFLKPNARRAPEDLEPPLSQRLEQIRLPNPFGWRLRPYSRPKLDHPSRYLYEDWKPDERPLEPALLDFKQAKANLAKKIETLTNQIAAFDQNLGEANAIVHQQNVDLSLPLGSFLELTNNPELFSFQAYADFFRTNQLTPPARRSAGPTPELYFKYLEQLKGKSGTNRNWFQSWSMTPGSTEDSVGPGLNQFQELFKLRVSSRIDDVTLKGPTTNYFLAVWKNLRAEQRKGELQLAKQESYKELKTLQERLESVDQAHLSLCLELAPERSLEVFRFSGAMPPQQP